MTSSLWLLEINIYSTKKLYRHFEFYSLNSRFNLPNR